MTASPPAPSSSHTAALKLVRAMIRGDMIEHAIVHLNEPDVGLGAWIDRVLAAPSDKDAPGYVRGLEDAESALQAAIEDAEADASKATNGQRQYAEYKVSVIRELQFRIRALAAQSAAQINAAPQASGDSPRKSAADSSTVVLASESERAEPVPAVAAPTTVPSAKTPPQELAWLVACKRDGALVGWLGLFDNIDYGWTLDPNKAIRFARQRDADMMLSKWEVDNGEVLSSEEHMWL